MANASAHSGMQHMNSTRTTQNEPALLKNVRTRAYDASLNQQDITYVAGAVLRSVLKLLNRRAVYTGSNEPTNQRAAGSQVRSGFRGTPTATTNYRP